VFLKAVKNEPFSGWHQKEFSAQTSSAEGYQKKTLTMNKLEKKSQTSNQIK